MYTHTMIVLGLPTSVHGYSTGKRSVDEYLRGQSESGEEEDKDDEDADAENKD